MDKTEFLNKIQEIGTCEDEAQRRVLLAEVSDNVSNLYDENENLTNSNKDYVSANEKLRSANMELFLRVGSTKTEEQKLEDNTGIKQEQPKEYKSYDDLAKEFIK